ncbi:MAG TPA: hypothetical protein VJ783_00445 [Pirellulales bacterium]|nr:hypothetical protein [Pirellulales bacterium]
MTRDDISDLLARGWIDINGRFMDSSNVALTDAGLAFLQKAVPAGAIRPVYDVDSRKLIVAGETILTLAVQARNLAAFLGAIERAGWRPRIAKPLDGRRCRDSTHHLAVAIHRLNLQQRLIDFHTDDGAATWNWRPGQRSRNGAGARSNRD